LGLVQTPASRDDARIVAALHDGDEATFSALVREYGSSMLRVAQMYVRTRAVAEEVVQEAWLGVLRGIGSFEGRSSLKTWIFRILTNTAKTRGEREARSVPFSALEGSGDDESAVAPERFQSEGRWAGHWAAPPSPWRDLPESRLLGAETRRVVAQAIAELPPAQAAVITMRDVEGFSADEVCNVLELSETNQRVLLHRARSKVRRALEAYLGQD
jgi:RNA polymerase sigma-70 factor (ECF subfamily)